MKHLGIRGAYIAGGAILSRVTKSEISDYDVYPKTKEDAKDIILGFMEESKHYFVVNITPRAVTLKSNDMDAKSEKREIIQVMIYDSFETPEKIFANFDFTVCMAAYDCDTDEYIYHKDFWPDVASRTLRFNPGTLYPLNSLLRVNKYREKGFYISKPELVKIALTVGQAEQPKSWQELEDQIGGSYGRSISLEAEDREYSFETALDVLSNLVFDFDQYERDNADKFSEVSDFEIELLFGTENVFMAHLENQGVLFVDKEGNILKVKRNWEMDFMSEDQIRPYEGEFIFGYKLVKKTEEPGVYAPALYYGKNDFRYYLGTEAVHEKHPWLHVSPTKSKDFIGRKDTAYYKVKFRKEDVKVISKKEIQVRALQLVEEAGE